MDWPAGLEKTSDDVRLIQAYENHTLEYRERLLRRHLGITEALLKDKDNGSSHMSADLGCGSKCSVLDLSREFAQLTMGRVPVDKARSLPAFTPPRFSSRPSIPRKVTSPSKTPLQECTGEAEKKRQERALLHYHSRSSEEKDTQNKKLRQVGIKRGNRWVSDAEKFVEEGLGEQYSAELKEMFKDISTRHRALYEGFFCPSSPEEFRLADSDGQLECYGPLSRAQYPKHRVCSASHHSRLFLPFLIAGELGDIKSRQIDHIIEQSFIRQQWLHLSRAFTVCESPLEKAQLRLAIEATHALLWQPKNLRIGVGDCHETCKRERKFSEFGISQEPVIGRLESFLIESKRPYLGEINPLQFSAFTSALREPKPGPTCSSTIRPVPERAITTRSQPDRKVKFDGRRVYKA
ncbi:hypothetical protein BV898_18877 [Hypsibius exemplaris]|uniref:Uncharacterized protein n=1 Tax=Hypsibius exemplaris TaxID=2072580 RepID=A0A9X6NI93_HYPEX|nr:hypothetical protein BV898_18877 [Hypsibius exemplaris]